VIQVTENVRRRVVAVNPSFPSPPPSAEVTPCVREITRCARDVTPGAREITLPQEVPLARKGPGTTGTGPFVRRASSAHAS
jgi:hypothetical protein